MKKIIGAINDANKKFNLIKDGDKIGVGVSGGKDSTILFIALKKFAQYMKKTKGWNIEVYGIHVIMNFYNVDYTRYKKWLKDNDLNVIFIESTIGDILKQHKSNKGNVVCSLCAKLKKAIMVKKAKELGINKMATGHHMDDAIETLFLNMLNNGKIATFLPCMYFDRNDIDMIRPLIMCREALLKEEAKKLEIPLIVNSCPNEHSTLRAEIKEILEKQFYRNPKFNKSYINLATSLTNKKQSKLWFDVLKED